MGSDKAPKQNDLCFAQRCAASSTLKPQRNERAQVINLSVLPHGARPRPFAPIEYDEVPNTRQLECPGYNRCLEFVASIRWQGFSCRRCPRNDASSWNASEKGADIVATKAKAAIIRFSRG